MSNNNDPILNTGDIKTHETLTDSCAYCGTSASTREQNPKAGCMYCPPPCTWDEKEWTEEDKARIDAIPLDKARDWVRKETLRLRGINEKLRMYSHLIRPGDSALKCDEEYVKELERRANETK